MLTHAVLQPPSPQIALDHPAAQVGPERLKLMIVDDYFPNLVSSFRVHEYHHYFAHIPRCKVFSSSPNLVRDAYTYGRAYPNYIHHLRPTTVVDTFVADLGYTIFLNNAAAFLPVFTAKRIPFIFTLYPGGGLHLGEAACDAKLAAVLASPLLQKVIVTQELTRKYLLAKRFCRPERMVTMIGAVCADLPTVTKAHYPADKSTIDVCFIAAKYHPQGLDKGYDTFIQVVQLLCHDPRFRFHVVGGFTAADHAFHKDVRITYYGYQSTEFFSQFHRGMDFIVSPTRAFMNHPGAFDGFPTACCVEAGYCGVIVITTDPLAMNPGSKRRRNRHHPQRRRVHRRYPPQAQRRPRRNQAPQCLLPPRLSPCVRCRRTIGSPAAAFAAIPVSPLPPQKVGRG